MTVLYLISSLFPFEDKQEHHSLLKSRCFASLDWQVLSITGFFPEWRDAFKFLSGKMMPTWWNLTLAPFVVGPFGSWVFPIEITLPVQKNSQANMGVKIGFCNYFAISILSYQENTTAPSLNSILSTFIKHLLCVRPCVALRGMKRDEICPSGRQRTTCLLVYEKDKKQLCAWVLILL